MSITSIKVRCHRVVDSLVWMERTLNDLTATVVDTDEPMRWWITADLGDERYTDIAHLAFAQRSVRKAPKVARVTWMLHLEEGDEPRAVAQLSGVLKSGRWRKSTLHFTTEHSSLFDLLTPHLRHELPPLPPPQSTWLPPSHTLQTPAAEARSAGSDRVDDQLGVEGAAGRAEMDAVSVEHVGRGQS
jgi:hypothetical protein